MTLEQLEFAITQYLDGTLPSEEIAALEQILASDPAAQGLLKEHEKLTALLRSMPGPEVNWGEVARDLSAVVTGSVDEESRAGDQKLNAIMKSAAPLPAIRWEELSRRISSAVDAEIAARDAEDEKLDALLRSAPMPDVKWDRLAEHLSKSIAAQAEEAEETDQRPAVVYRIGWARRVTQLAMAACILVAAGVGISMYMKGPPSTGGTGSVGLTPVAIVETPKVEVAVSAPVVEISIGPSKAYAASGEDEIYRRGMASRSPVVIATPAGGDDDGDRGLVFFE